MYGGLLMLLGECKHAAGTKSGMAQGAADPHPARTHRLGLLRQQGHHFFRVAGFYDTFLGMLSKGEARE